MRHLPYRLTSASRIFISLGLIGLSIVLLSNGLQSSTAPGQIIAQSSSGCGDSAFPCRRQPAGSSMTAPDLMPSSPQG